MAATVTIALRTNAVPPAAMPPLHESGSILTMYNTAPHGVAA
jgi:hypothetical protein